MEKAEAKLEWQNQLSSRYRQALAKAYFLKIRPDRPAISFSRYVWALRKILSLYPEFKVEGIAIYNLLQAVFGFMAAEIIVRFAKQLTNQLGVTRNEC
jgi:hypothetical protein